MFEQDKRYITSEGMIVKCVSTGTPHIFTSNACGMFHSIKTDAQGVSDCGKKVFKFPETSCSQCGRDFGPGNHGFSHCEDHRK